MHQQNHLLRAFCWLMLIASLCILTKFILFKEGMRSFERPGISRHHHRHFQEKNLQLFATIRRISHSDMSSDYKYRNIGGNVLGFIPVGMFLPVLVFHRGRAWKTVLAVFLLSLGFESVQLYTGSGVFDVDDIFLNTVGGICGYMLQWLVPRRSLEVKPA